MTTDQKPWRAEMPDVELKSEGNNCFGQEEFSRVCLADEVDGIVHRANAELDAARARIAELEAAQQWRPMETAPKGRTRILVSFGRNGTAKRVVVAWWVTTGVDRRFHDEIQGYWATSDRCACTSELLGWLPLPEPPKEGT